MTLPEIEVSIAKLEKVWREVGGEVDYTHKNVDPEVLCAFAEKQGLDVHYAEMLNTHWCTMQINRGSDQFTVTLWESIEVKQKAPAATEA